MKFKVVLRRGQGFQVKPEAECLDGKIFEFDYGWKIPSGMYLGETAYVPILYDEYQYPLTAPSWLASGDLEAV